MPKSKSKESLEEIYTLIVESLKIVMPNVEEKLDYYRKLDCKSWDDRDFFEVLTRSVFTGIRDDIIESSARARNSIYQKIALHCKIIIAVSTKISLKHKIQLTRQPSHYPLIQSPQEFL